MATTVIRGPKIAAISTCVPSRRFDNVEDTSNFPREEVRKVVAMAGVRARRVADDSICSSDLCVVAAESALKSVDWKPDSVDGLILVTQTPDYFLPSTSCVIHRRLGLSERCATFDVGLGCSGYPYGLWLAAMMLRTGGLRRVLLLHGDTSSRFCDKSDRSVSLLFGDAGSATALEASDPETCQDWAFLLHTDGSGWRDMIIEAGGFRDRFSNDARRHYVSMSGANVFNFTIKRVPQLIQDTLSVSGVAKEQVDYFIFHQSNGFIIKHIMQKVRLSDTRVPMILGEFGNTGGASIPLTITHGALIRPPNRSLKIMLLGYGVGLSWASALVSLEPTVLLEHAELSVAGD
jgi:3-oxoacyl-[acyl-carrier-protein] synthase-3